MSESSGTSAIAVIALVLSLISIFLWIREGLKYLMEAIRPIS